MKYFPAGNYIDASAAYIACNWDNLGSSLAVFPIDAAGRQDRRNVRRIQVILTNQRSAMYSY